jgi:hypothetical protein
MFPKLAHLRLQTINQRLMSQIVSKPADLSVSVYVSNETNCCCKNGNKDNQNWRQNNDTTETGQPTTCPATDIAPGMDITQSQNHTATETDRAEAIPRHAPTSNARKKYIRLY